MDERQRKAEKLAREVLEISRNSLMISMRFMDTAFCRMDLSPAEGLDRAEGTDGETFFYDPMKVLRSYQTEQSAPVRAYLHLILHCVFQHPFVKETINREIWDLSCDIAVENIIQSLNLSQVTVIREEKQKEVLKRLSEDLKLLTAEKLYRYFLKKAEISQDFGAEWRELSDLFSCDSHDLWYKKNNSQEDEDSQKKSSGKPDQTGEKNEEQKRKKNRKKQEPDSGESSEESSEDASGKDHSDEDENEKEAENEGEGSESGSGKEGDTGENEDAGAGGKTEGERPREGSRRGREDGGSDGGDASSVWASVAEHLKTDLETFSREAGLSSGDLFQSLREVTREKVSYEDFLKQFSVLGEVMKQSEDEFDYVYYTYGLSLYRNMPLIEPLEYRDLKKVRELVIAIDTSGSVSGELVQLFVQKTYNILLEEESFFRKVNIHIIQCDATIQEDKKITSREEFEEYIGKMELHGFGGTDFRPVFHFVDQLREAHAFTNLKGLIYFTDGYGTFPEHMPDYRTAFVFVKDAFEDVQVPPWAVKLVLEEDEIREFQ